MLDVLGPVHGQVRFDHQNLDSGWVYRHPHSLRGMLREYGLFRIPNGHSLAMGAGLAIVGVSLLLVASVSRYLSGTPLTPAILVVAIGVLVGPLALDELAARPTSSLVRTLAEATLAVVLFSDSSRIDLRALKSEVSMPIRLLGIGLILTVVAGGLTAVALFKSFSLNDALILGVVLAPTDAGLGSAVVTDDRLPQVVRQSLNVESGLNDGICVPLLLILLATTAGAEAHPLTVVAEEIGYGVLCGAGAALLSAAIVVLAGRRNLIDKTWQQIVPLATTIAAYGAANALGGSGFIAAFVAGALFGLLFKERGGPSHALHRGDRSHARQRHVPGLRGDTARSGVQAHELAHRALCRPESDRRADGAGGHRTLRHACPAGNGCLHGLVRSAGTGVDRVRRDRRRRPSATLC